jgi:hypothetical protein
MDYEPQLDHQPSASFSVRDTIVGQNALGINAPITDSRASNVKHEHYGTTNYKYYGNFQDRGALEILTAYKTGTAPISGLFLSNTLRGLC